MRLRDTGEVEFLQRLQLRFAHSGDVVRRGIGDDAAVVSCPGDRSLVLSNDAAVAGRHFRREWLSPLEIGRRAALAAISDMAAMGAQPVALLLMLAASPDEEVETAEAIVAGVASAAREMGAVLAGGETVSTDGPLTLDVTVAGLVPEGRELLRGAARPGELLLVSGALGDSAAGLAVLQSEARVAEALPCVERYKGPTPRVGLGRLLVEVGVRCAIDVSDGLVRDASHIARASGVQGLIEAQDLPISRACRAAADALAADPIEWALGGGEDFELLFAAPPPLARNVIDRAARDLSLTITPIGRIEEGAGVRVQAPEGGDRPVQTPGWDHFTGG